MPETQPSCATRRFWLQFQSPHETAPGISAPNGVCRRYAPTKYHPCYGDNPFPPTGSPWPWTAHDQWCGEHVDAR